MFKSINPRFFVQLYSVKSEVEKLLLFSCLFSSALTVIRILYTGQWMFAWLSWNLFLAFVPYLISRFAINRGLRFHHPARLAAVFVVWLLFLPNAFYIITDLFHLEIRAGVPLWFDLALIFSFVWNGILLGVLSVRHMEKLFTATWPGLREWQFVYPIMLLNAFGMYIGRYLRYNSWDVVVSPFQLTQDLCYIIFHPIRHRFDWSMILCYSVFMTLIYMAIKRMSKALW